MSNLFERSINQPKFRVPAVGAFTAIAISAAGSVMAQSAATASANNSNTAATPTQGMLQEVVVTAEKRKERAVDVPISVTTVTGTKLDASGITQELDLPQLVPSLRLTYSGTFVEPTIRGIGSQVALPGLPQNIATYVDGYYVPDPAADNFNLINTTSVSVLKGPQGTLFGYNATGGAIQITTADPQQTPSFMARTGVASYNDASDAFYGTTGLTSDLAVNLATSFEHGDGYIDNLYDDNKDAGEFTDWYIRPKVLWTPTDDMSFLFAYAHDYDNNPITQDVVPRNGETIGIAVPGTEIVTTPGVVDLNAPTYARITSDSYTLTSKFNLGFAGLTSYTGYRKDTVAQGLDYDATPAALNGSAWTVPDTTFTQELDLASQTSGPLNWVGGAFYMHYTDSYDYNTNSTPIFNSKNTTDSYAVFANVTYEIAPKLFLTGGGRYSIDRPSVYFDLIPYSLAESGDTEFHNFSGRGVLRYELTPASNVYASFTQGYKAGGLPASAFSLIPVQPETIDAYEVGYKLATGRVHASVATFFYNYKNIQVTTYGAGGASDTVNAALAHSYGVDGDLAVQVTQDLELTLNGGFTHAYYVSFPNATATSQNLNPASPGFGTISLVPFDATGLPTERTPRFSGSIGADYGFSVIGGGRVVLNANLFYTTHFNFDVAGQLPQNAYGLVNLRATWTDPSGHFDVSAYANNVGNTAYYIQSFTDPYASRATFGAPRIIGGSVTYHY
jgi:iron complex outermembrane recepter protein